MNDFDTQPVTMLKVDGTHNKSGKISVKGKARPGTSHEGPDGEKNYISTRSLTSALDLSGRLKPRPSRFSPGKETGYP